MEQQAEGNSSKDNYLRYTKLEAGKPANFALLEEDPLCYWLVWADGTDGSAKPFRFVSQPSQADIDSEFGTNYTQALNYDKTGPRKPQECLTWPVYNWDLSLVQVLEVSHVSLARQFAKYGLNRKYSKNLLGWDFELSKIQADMTRYELLIVPRDDEEHSDDKMDAAWEKAQKNGFDLQQMVVGGDPFNPAG
jgi:hypothetical protein